MGWNGSYKSRKVQLWREERGKLLPLKQREGNSEKPAFLSILPTQENLEGGPVGQPVSQCGEKWVYPGDHEEGELQSHGNRHQVNPTTI